MGFTREQENEILIVAKEQGLTDEKAKEFLAEANLIMDEELDPLCVGCNDNCMSCQKF
ncbi:MAG: hypothetical protein FWD49_07045 [Firmicutes bacterium]|nr:hypothetical protein [Bacillota bacterium]